MQRAILVANQESIEWGWDSEKVKATAPLPTFDQDLLSLYENERNFKLIEGRIIPTVGNNVGNEIFDPTWRNSVKNILTETSSNIGSYSGRMEFGEDIAYRSNEKHDQKEQEVFKRTRKKENM